MAGMKELMPFGLVGPLMQNPLSMKNNPYSPLNMLRQQFTEQKKPLPKPVRAPNITLAAMRDKFNANS